MNKDNAKDYLPLVQALAEGKVIQVNSYYQCGGEAWDDSKNVKFCHPPHAYRIKPEPKEIWVNEYPWGGEAVHHDERHARFAVHGTAGVTRRYLEVIE